MYKDRNSSIYGKNICIYRSMAFAVFLITEVMIGKFADPGGFVRCYLGDVLVMPTMYFFIRIFTDRSEKTLPLMLFGFACIVELLQSADICGRLGIDKGSLLAVVIGTKGDFKDIICYACGTVLIYALAFAERTVTERRHL